MIGGLLNISTDAPTVQIAQSCIDAVVRTSLQSCAFAGAIWLVCKAFPRIPASVKCSLWWLACLRLLVGLIWTQPVNVPLLNPTPLQLASATSPSTHFSQMPRNSSGSELTTNTAQVVRPPVPPRGSRIPWQLMVMALWLIGISWRAAVLLRQFRSARALMSSARYIEGSWIRETGERLARRLGLNYIPHICSSDEVSSPVVVGMYEPVILVPSNDVYDCDNESLRLAIAHEMAHVRRNDLWLGVIPSLAQSIFFFHPIAWFASREYSLAREEACDAEAIRLTGIGAQEYGRLLLKFGVAGRSSGAVIGLGASTNAKLLKRRLQMLENATMNIKFGTKAAMLMLFAVAVAGLAPLQLVAKESKPVRLIQPRQAMPPAAPVQPVKPAPPVANVPPTLVSGLDSGYFATPDVVIPHREVKVASSALASDPIGLTIIQQSDAATTQKPSAATQPTADVDIDTTDLDNLDKELEKSLAPLDDPKFEKQIEQLEKAEAAHVLNDPEFAKKIDELAKKASGYTANDRDFQRKMEEFAKKVRASAGQPLTDQQRKELEQEIHDSVRSSIDAQQIASEARQEALSQMTDALKSLQEAQSEMKSQADSTDNASADALADQALAMKIEKRAMDQAMKSLQRSIDRMKTDLDSSPAQNAPTTNKLKGSSSVPADDHARAIIASDPTPTPVPEVNPQPAPNVQISALTPVATPPSIPAVETLPSGGGAAVVPHVMTRVNVDAYSCVTVITP